MPVRQVSNRGGNFIGRFPSYKMQRMIAYESLIECDYLYLADYAAEITHIEEQPCTIHYRHAGKLLKYTPDFYVIESGQHILIECKPAVFTNTEENLRKFTAAQEHCAEQGWLFRVVTDTNLRTGFLLRNVKTLTRYARHPVSPQHKGAIFAALYAAPTPLTLKELAAQARPGNPAPLTADILHLVYHRQVCVCLTSALLTMDSIVTLPAS